MLGIRSSSRLGLRGGVRLGEAAGQHFANSPSSPAFARIPEGRYLLPRVPDGRCPRSRTREHWRVRGETCSHGRPAAQPCILSRISQSLQKPHNRQLARGAKSMVAATYPLFSIRCGNHWYRNRARARASGQRERATGAGIRQQAASRGALLAAPGGAAHRPRELTGTVIFLSLAHLASATGTVTAAAPVDQRYLFEAPDAGALAIRAFRWSASASPFPPWCCSPNGAT
jgi:hypothetical protein